VCSSDLLSVKTFGYHKRTTAKSSLCLVEVPLAAPVHIASKALRLAVGTRYTIEITSGFDADTLERLLEVLNR
jgi:hypothetical protein